jgi:uncharacterized Rmd1/YagE family protein
MSKNKPIKNNKMNKVSFKFKTKGAKPIVTTDITMFNITGGDFDAAQLSEILAKSNVVSLDE